MSAEVSAETMDYVSRQLATRLREPGWKPREIVLDALVARIAELEAIIRDREDSEEARS